LLRDTLAARIREYRPANAIEQENVLQELLQHFVLASLSRSGLFAEAIFHGGTCLRIVHGINRFSEDLDFLLKRPDPGFRWGNHLAQVVDDCHLEGLRFEVLDKSEAVGAVRKAFLKTDSIGALLSVELPFHRLAGRKIRIKLEVDTNPPAGSAFETSYLAFPNTAVITTQSLPSGFAMKSHALLCREYVKGRDWYDFVWYVTRRIAPDLPLLAAAVAQQGPWKGQALELSPGWLLDTLAAKIDAIDWPAAREDVRRFVPAGDQQGVDAWSKEFFRFHLGRLAETLSDQKHRATGPSPPGGR